MQMAQVNFNGKPAGKDGSETPPSIKVQLVSILSDRHPSVKEMIVAPEPRILEVKSLDSGTCY